MINRDVYLQNSEITRIDARNKDQFPVLIRLVQNTNINTGSSSNDIIEKRKAQSGNFGKNYFDFTVDFTCAPILIGSNNDPFKEINNILQSKISPTFSRDYFLSNYIVLKITDYGHQSMSPGFRDFVPFVFINGQKIFQKYVGIIRQYSKSAAFLIISKNNNLGIKDIKDSDKEDGHELKIRIIFKNNIEYSQDVQDFITLTLDTNETTNGVFVFSGSLTDNDFKFLSNKDLSDYDIYSNEKKLICPYDMMKVSFTKNSKGDVLDQNNCRRGEKHIHEYYRQSYVHDYAGHGDEKSYCRNVDYNITIELSKRFFSEGDFGKENSSPIIKIKSRQNNYNAEYEIYETSEEFKNLKLLDLNVFDTSGKKVYTLDTLAINTEYEIIQEYSSRIKNIFKATEDITSLNTNDITYNFKIYPYLNYDGKDECVVYKSDGTFKEIFYGTASNSIATGSHIELYNDFSEGITNDAKLLTKKELKLSLEYSTVKSIDPYTNKASVSNGILVGVTPKDNFILKNSDRDINLFVVINSFPIFYEKQLISPKVYFYKFPEWLYDGRMEMFRAMEYEVYVDQKLSDGEEIYYSSTTQKLSDSEEYSPCGLIGPESGSENGTSLDFGTLSNLNIINYNDLNDRLNSTVIKIKKEEIKVDN